MQRSTLGRKHRVALIGADLRFRPACWVTSMIAVCSAVRAMSAASVTLDPALSAGALFALTYALIEGHDQGWTSSLILGSFAIAAALGIAFVGRERGTSEPMVAVSLFRERVFSGGLIALIMWGFGLFGIYFFTSPYLQNVLGFSPTEAGAAFVPMALLMAGCGEAGRSRGREGASRGEGAGAGLVTSRIHLGTRRSVTSRRSAGPRRRA